MGIKVNFLTLGKFAKKQCKLILSSFIKSVQKYANKNKHYKINTLACTCISETSILDYISK